MEESLEESLADGWWGLGAGLVVWWRAGAGPV